MLGNIWNFQIQIVQVGLAMIVYELPALVRRLRTLYYVPVYFGVFPFRALNKPLSEYFGEGVAGRGENLSNDKADLLRRYVVRKSTLSMAIDALAVPLVIGFLLAFFINPDVFRQFLICLLVYKLLTIAFSIKNFHFHIIGTVRNHFLVTFIYLLYISVVYKMVSQSYNWAHPMIESEQYGDLVSKLTGLFLHHVVVQWIIVATISAIVVGFITDRELREETITKVSSPSQDTKPNNPPA